MNRTNIECYYNSLSIIKTMKQRGLINDTEFATAEKILAKKHCIKKGSIYRSNNLINSDFRAIYIMQKKEVDNARKNDNENRCVTTIRKEN